MRTAAWLGLAAVSTGASAACLPLAPAEIDRIMAVKADGPGCAVAIVEDGRTVFARGYGLADLDAKRPVTPDTVFNVASMTKQFTGMAVALLIADGKLGEQDDIRKYLPELRDYGAPIRVAHLLNHSSGLRNHMALAAFQPGDHLPSHEEALALVYRQSALNFAPGTRHQYESPNYVLLAEIVGRVSGMGYERFVAERILTPLGMANSGFATPSLARAYAPSPDGGFRLQEKVNGARGSSGLLASVEDFALWMANYDRLAVGGGGARERMLSTSTLADGTPLTYRYGLVKEIDYSGVAGLTRISHGGQTAAFRSAFSYFPGRGFGSVVMCNHLTDARGKEQAIADAWFKRHFPASAAKEAAVAAFDLALFERLAGTYFSGADDEVRSFAVKEGQLAFEYYGQAYPLSYLGGGRFGFPGLEGAFVFADGSVREEFAEQAKLAFAKLPSPPAQDFAPFAGRYRSADVDGEVIVEARPGGILLRYPAGEAELKPIARDRFSNPAADFNHVAFQRDAAGRVSGLSLSVSSGITRLRFARAGG